MNDHRGGDHSVLTLRYREKQTGTRGSRCAGERGALGRRLPRLLVALLLLAGCESFTGAAAPTTGPTPDLWGQALYAGIGDTPEQVRATIGEPTRRTVDGNRETWIYVHPDRPGATSNLVGTVTFVDNHVSTASMGALLTP